MIKVSHLRKFNNQSTGSVLERGRSSSSKHYQYVLGGYTVAFTSEVSRLHAFRVKRFDGQSNQSSMPAHEPITSANRDIENGHYVLQYSGSAPFAGTQREVQIWRYEQFVKIVVDETPVSIVDSLAQHIYLLNDKPFDDDLNLEVVIGPALIPLILDAGTICLHAGAVALPAGNVVFVAESGVGKSTLSAHRDERWAQVADDILPLSKNGFRLCMERYPQLKLPNALAKAAPNASQEIDLIVRLSLDKSEEISFHQLSAKDSLLEIIRHTVAAKLFDESLLSTQLGLAQQIAESVPMVELRHPRELENLTALQRVITKYLEQMQKDS